MAEKYLDLAQRKVIILMQEYTKSLTHTHVHFKQGLNLSKKDASDLYMLKAMYSSPGLNT